MTLPLRTQSRTLDDRAWTEVLALAMQAARDDERRRGDALLARTINALTASAAAAPLVQVRDLPRMQSILVANLSETYRELARPIGDRAQHEAVAEVLAARLRRAGWMLAKAPQGGDVI